MRFWRKFRGWRRDPQDHLRRAVEDEARAKGASPEEARAAAVEAERDRQRKAADRGGAAGGT